MKNKKSTVLRIPRPIGLTPLMIEYHKSQDATLIEKIRTMLIQQWIISSGLICGRSMNLYELSDFLKVQPEIIRLQMRDQMLNTKLFDKNHQEEFLEALVGQQVTWALEDRMEVEQQLNILKGSQKGTYTPFVSAEVNKALALKLSSSNNLAQVVRSLQGGGSINIFNQNNNQQVQQGVTQEEALEIIQTENKKLALPEDAQYLEGHYDLEQLPEVVATKQQGDFGEKEGLKINSAELNAITDNYKQTINEFEETHHEMRREIEMNIDQDSEDPELEIYPG